MGPKAELEKDGCKHCPGELIAPGQGGAVRLRLQSECSDEQESEPERGR